MGPPAEWCWTLASLGRPTEILRSAFCRTPPGSPPGCRSPTPAAKAAPAQTPPTPPASPPTRTPSGAGGPPASSAAGRSGAAAVRAVVAGWVAGAGGRRQRMGGAARGDDPALKTGRAGVDAGVASFDDPATHGEASWPRDERLAFWINAYNAYTIALMNQHHERKSIRNINKTFGLISIKGPWTESMARVGGETYTLLHIENEIIRKQYHDARIHFAIVCASMGCPPLRS